jgi:hypothetical protein
MAPFGHVPGNRWDALSRVSGGGREVVPSANGAAQELVSDHELLSGPFGFYAPIGVSVRAGYFLCRPGSSGKARLCGFARQGSAVRESRILSENPCGIAFGVRAALGLKLGDFGYSRTRPTPAVLRVATTVVF